MFLVEGTVDYLESQPSKTIVKVNDYGDADLIAEIVVDGKVFQIHNKKTVPTSSHVVRYYSYKSGELLLTTSVVDGQTPSTPGIPSLTGWTFTGWDKTVGPCYADTNYYGTWESTQTANLELASSDTTASDSVQFKGYEIPVGANISARITGDIYHAANPNHSVKFKLYSGTTTFFTSDPVYCPDKATVQIDTSASYTITKAATYFKLYAVKVTSCTAKWTLNMTVKFVLT